MANNREDFVIDNGVVQKYTGKDDYGKIWSVT